MAETGHLQEETDGPLVSFCWGDDYLDDPDADPWQADLIMPGAESVLSGCGKSRQEAIDNLKAKIPKKVRDGRQAALLYLEFLGVNRETNHSKGNDDEHGANACRIEESPGSLRASQD